MDNKEITQQEADKISSNLLGNRELSEIITLDEFSLYFKLEFWEKDGKTVLVSPPETFVDIWALKRQGYSYKEK